MQEFVAAPSIGLKREPDEKKTENTGQQKEPRSCAGPFGLGFRIAGWEWTSGRVFAFIGVGLQVVDRCLCLARRGLGSRSFWLDLGVGWVYDVWGGGARFGLRQSLIELSGKECSREDVGLGFGGELSDVVVCWVGGLRGGEEIRG
jgi:hypothetical protein